MKRSVLFLVSLFVVTTMVAAPVSQQRAMQVAQQFIPVPDAQAQAPGMRAEEQPANIVYTHPMPKSGRPAFYVVNVGGSFVIVSADDVAHQVLGYNLGKNWPVAANGEVQLPSQVKGFFDDLAAQMEAAIEANPNHASDTEWSQPQSAPQRRMLSEMPDSVGPLLTTTWGQGSYYNSLCPEEQNSPDGHCPTGCVATAMAQIINYWGYPVHGRGIHSYESNYGTQAVNYDSAHYDFAHMPALLTNTSTPQEIQAVATLMRDCGVAANMEYGVEESNAFDVDARAGLINFFRFGSNLSFAEKSFFKESEWNEMLKADLSANCPIIYSGRGIGNHTFVCDGYKQDGFFHFNFGWSGYFDAWYLLSAVTPTQSDYSSNQSALLGIVPDSTANVILGQTTGISSFVVDDPLEFFHLFGKNAYKGNNYSNPCNNTINFISSDTTIQLVTDILEFEGQSLSIRDNNNTDLRDLLGGEENNLSPVVSPNGFNIAYSGNMYHAGFKLRISQDNGCRMVSNIITSLDTTTVHLIWTENGTATQWQIEYGEEGFLHGEGILIMVNNNTVDITFPQRLAKYDVYIRSICGNDSFDPWVKKSILSEAPYWHEVITEQPQGFEEDSLGNIMISTAEGLAWWSRLQQSLSEHSVYYSGHWNVTLSADIDMTQYKWKPISIDNITVNGSNNTIYNLYVVENGYSDGGLFDAVSNSIVKNISLKNIHIFKNNTNYVGGITGYAYSYGEGKTIIENCIVKGEISGGARTGGIVGVSNNTDILNSVSICDIKSLMSGGICCLADQNSVIKNCYEAGTINEIKWNAWYGNIVANAYGGTIQNCYYKNSLQGLFSGAIPYSEHAFIENIEQFSNESGVCLLNSPVIFEDTACSSLVAALNKGVEAINRPYLKLWDIDELGANDGYPVFGKDYIVVCPNITNLQLRNIQRGDSNGVVIGWNENGSATQWQVRYKHQDSSSYSQITTFLNPDTIMGLTIGNFYSFGVRPVCDETHRGAWTDDVTFGVSTPCWSDVVVSEPNGFKVDTNGDISISTAEGLAWLISVVNGFNGQIGNNLNGKNIHLKADLDMSQWRWVSIKDFSGSFDGENHIVEGITILEQENNQGFFGTIENAHISNLILQNVSISALENVGGLCGYSQVSTIDNCSVTGDIIGMENVGGLIGKMDNGITRHNYTSTRVTALQNQAGGLIGEIMATQSSEESCCIVSDCYSKSKVKCFSNVSGGLIGVVNALLGDIVVENSYSCDSVIGFVYAGGLVGAVRAFYANKATIRNCCSYSTVEANPWIQDSEYPEEWLNGAFIGQCTGNVTLSKIYKSIEPGSDLLFIGSHHGLNNDFSVTDSSWFYVLDTTATLNTPVTINRQIYTDAVRALNAWVDIVASKEYHTWIKDTTIAHWGMPVFGPLFEEVCPSVDTIFADSVREDGVILIWNAIDNVSSWRVEYGLHGFERGSGIIINVADTVIRIDSLTTGQYYDFYVQANCGNSDIGQCGNMLCAKPDKKYWIDVVTSVPDGYSEDDQGNAYISSPEGLAWLISKCNGLNGENHSGFNGKTVFLTRDVEMGEYQWSVIQNFEGVFDGRGHSISGIYMNSQSDNNAMIEWLYGTFKNTRFNGTIKGNNNIAGICVRLYGTIMNCGIDCNMRSNRYTGIITSNNYGSIVNSYSTGSIYGMDGVGGAIGFNYGNVQNSYSATDVESPMWCLRDITSTWIGQFSGRDIVNNEQNSAYWYNSQKNISNEILGDCCGSIGYYSFEDDGSIWSLSVQRIINGQTVSTLLSALNAWVDANNEDSIYCHWEADTVMVNGGFPIFAPMPVEPVGPGTEIDNYKETNRPARKVFERGHLYILLPDGTKYSATGKKVE